MSILERQSGETTPKNALFWGHHDFPAFCRHQQMQRILLRALLRQQWDTLAGKEILDVGCGNGRMLRQYLEWGAAPDDAAGIEWDEALVEEAFFRHSDLDIRTGSADELPWEADRFDAVSLFEAMSRVPEKQQRQRVAAEIHRVLRPGGVVFWYDHASHADLAISKAEIRQLFPEYRLRLQRTSLSLSVAGSFPQAWLPVAYSLLSAMPGLRTHWLGILRKR